MNEYAGKERRKQEPRWPWWRDIDWAIVGIVAILTAIIGVLIISLSYDARFSRNFTVGCAAAGGIVVSLDHVPSCVTVTPVPAQVTR
jgi:hypothetical protein